MGEEGAAFPCGFSSFIFIVRKSNGWRGRSASRVLVLLTKGEEEEGRRDGEGKGGERERDGEGED